ncbi:MAG TPA: LysM peptidoglycan-binding domain-containing protein, partial [Herpetosiphonaceae bacterium]|nr:LysM peptidoglycan-binding domain-containing protein [Herpetosiphonaceae bacterium]
GATERRRSTQPVDHVANTVRSLIRLGAVLALLALAGCAGDPLSSAGRIVPTAQPDIRITPAPAQDVRATATAFARQAIPTPTPAGLYIVKPGDTLSKIADEHATTVDEIMAANNLSDPNRIEIGQHLTIPSGEPASDITGTAAPGIGDAGELPASSIPEATASP